MHILLINAFSPKPSKIRGEGYWNLNPRQRFFPVGLARIGTHLEENQHSVEIFDMNLFKNSFQKLKKRLEKRDYDVVGISLRNIWVRAVQLNLPIDIFAKTVKMIKNYDTKLVVGGPGFTMFAKELMERFRIDFGVVGEGEETFLDLLKNLNEPKKVKGICYRKNRKIIFTKKRKPVENLDMISRKDLEGLPKNFNIYDEVGIETRRGCRFRCAYCSYSVIQDKSVRFRSPEVVVEEIECLQNNFGVDKFFFVDCIFHPRSHMEKVCDLLIKRKIDMNWTAHFREDTINKKLVEKIVKSGCTNLTFSPDSGSHKILQILQKGITPKQILKATIVIRNFKEVNTTFNMFLNAPGETINSLKETFALVSKMREFGLDGYISFNRIQIYPHTKIYEMALKNNIIDRNTDLLKPRYYDPPPLNLFAKANSTIHLFSIPLSP